MNQAVEQLLENQIRNLPRDTVELSLLSDENDTSLVFCREGDVFRESCSDNPVHHIRMKQMMPCIKRASSLNPEINVAFFLNTCDHIEGFALDSQYPTLCFCKNKNQKAVTIPNIDFYSGELIHDLHQVTAFDIPHKEKQNGSVFVGASTGQGDRLRYCESVYESRQHYGYISHVVGGIDKEDYPNFNMYTGLPFLSIGDQLRFKFLINIDGYGLCYSRLYWQMLSNSVPVYLNGSKDLTQLYDYFLEPNVHYIESTIDEWPEKYEFLINTPEGQSLCEEVAQQGKSFCHEFFSDTANDTVDIWSLVLKGIREKKD